MSSKRRRAGHAVCLRNENPGEFTLLHEALVTEHEPATTTEHLTVHEMARLPLVSPPRLGHGNRPPR